MLDVLILHGVRVPPSAQNIGRPRGAADLNKYIAVQYTSPWISSTPHVEALPPHFQIKQSGLNWEQLSQKRYCRTLCQISKGFG